MPSKLLSLLSEFSIKVIMFFCAILLKNISRFFARLIFTVSSSLSSFSIITYCCINLGTNLPTFPLYNKYNPNAVAGETRHKTHFRLSCVLSYTLTYCMCRFLRWPTMRACVSAAKRQMRVGSGWNIYRICRIQILLNNTTFLKTCNFNKYSNFIFYFSKNACQSPITQPSRNSSAPQKTSTGRYPKCTHQSNTHTWIKHAITAATLKSIPSASSKRIGNYTTYLYTNSPTSLTSITSSF